jgi:hypothetical protein
MPEATDWRRLREVFRSDGVLESVGGEASYETWGLMITFGLFFRGFVNVIHKGILLCRRFEDDFLFD